MSWLRKVARSLRDPSRPAGRHYYGWGHGVTPLLCLVSIVSLLLVFTDVAEGRLGGGQSFSGGGGGSGGSGGSGGGGDGAIFELIIWLCIEHPVVGVPLLIVFIAYCIWNQKNQSGAYAPSQGPGAGASRLYARRTSQAFETLREHDSNFSEVIFRDFVYTLYAKLHRARGLKTISNYAPYANHEAIATLVSLNRGDGELAQVKGVIVGAMNIQEVMRPAGPVVTVKVQFETNYSEVREVDGKKVEATYYCVENWKLTRRADVLSPEPDKVRSVGCPSCGSSLELKPDGACQHCGVAVRPGDHHWSVRHIHIIKRQKRGPLLTADVPEMGTDRMTVMDPLYKQHRELFDSEHEGFDWDKTNERFSHVFYALQNAWTSQDWQKARPFETDSLFQNHVFWMRQYAQQNLRNVLGKIELGRIEPVKIRSDRFYDAITCRVYASMVDYTTDKDGKLLCGNKDKPRSFSEYWTFIRGRGVSGHDKSDDQCPSCGAGLKINMAGRCEYCNSKITTGKFDWVLSTIEQDESYSG